VGPTPKIPEADELSRYADALGVAVVAR